uniref:HDC00687 n=1 Tax=Drosophila melanogaster TaxID=7227 RepID=Q6IHW3_DROME|nr:TPA_inf: HDC00687 [Drosophila melanogaster]
MGKSPTHHYSGVFSLLAPAIRLASSGMETVRFLARSNRKMPEGWQKEKRTGHWQDIISLFDLLGTLFCLLKNALLKEK